MLKNVIIFPVGSHEYHGEFLPPETDTLIASRIALDLAKKFNKSHIIPALGYGVSYEHSDFSSTITVNTEPYASFILNLLDSIDANDSLIILLNGHGGNTNIIGAIESDYNYRHDKSKVFAPQIYNKKVKDVCIDLLGEFDTHAGSVESSLLSYYGNIPIKDLIKEDDLYIKQMHSSLRFFRNAQVSKSGIIKGTNKLIINTDYGKAIHKVILEQLYEEITNTKKAINKVLNLNE